MSVLFLGKEGDYFCGLAAEFTRQNFPGALVVLGQRGQELPPQAAAWQGEHIISYLSPWVVPGALLERAGRSRINFHTGPPEYPGIGCTNFALYNQETTYGVTCHHMLTLVDTGAIIAVRRFQVLASDSVWSLTKRCYAHILVLFYEMAGLLALGAPLPSSSEQWTRQPYRRSQLNELCRLTPDMSAAEIRRRVRATKFPNMPGAFVELGGSRFVLED